MTDTQPLPPIEYGPPYSLEFVAHLHGGCYSADITPLLLAAVSQGLSGRRMLDDLTIVQLELSVVGAASPGHS